MSAPRRWARRRRPGAAGEPGRGDGVHPEAARRRRGGGNESGGAVLASGRPPPERRAAAAVASALLPGARWRARAPPPTRGGRIPSAYRALRFSTAFLPAGARVLAVHIDMFRRAAAAVRVVARPVPSRAVARSLATDTVRAGDALRARAPPATPTPRPRARSSWTRRRRRRASSTSSRPSRRRVLARARGARRPRAPPAGRAEPRHADGRVQGPRARLARRRRGRHGRRGGVRHRDPGRRGGQDHARGPRARRCAGLGRRRAPPAGPSPTPSTTSAATPWRSKTPAAQHRRRARGVPTTREHPVPARA